MKIAVASQKEMVAGHFGHCENFNIYDISDGKVISDESIPNPGHKPGFLPNYLHDLGVNVIVSGGMGGGAIDIFNGHGIEVVVGPQGKAVDAIEKYIKGELKSTGSICTKHEHSDECH
jgi:predicted Fe-Mo cluster-binding NifX family protein